MHFDIGDCLLKVLERGCRTGIFQGGVQIDAGFRAASVAASAVLFYERRDLFLEGGARFLL